MISIKPYIILMTKIPKWLHILAQIIYGEHANAITSIMLKDDKVISQEKRSDLENQILQFNENTKNLTAAICYSFKKQKLNPRKEIDVVLKEVDDNTGIIVLNWDESIWNTHDKIKNVLQIHGRVFFPGTLIFPMEIGIEKAYFKDKIEDKINHEDIEAIRTVHGLAYDWMCKTKRIVSWGVGYNVYDSEFNMLIGSALYTRSEENRLSSVFNINTDPKNDIAISRLMNIPITNIENYFL